MKCTLLIPPEGLMELFNWDKPGREVLEERGFKEGNVNLALGIDNDVVGVAHINTLVEHPENTRGMEAVRYLSAAHVTIYGPLVLELTERDAIEIMREIGQ